MANDMHRDELGHRLGTCYKVLDEYSWLLDSYILDFFVENHARNLPESWTRILRDIPLKELGYFLDFESTTCGGYIWPLSLTVLRFLVKHLSLPRKPRKGAENASPSFAVRGAHEMQEVPSTLRGNGENHVASHSLLSNQRLTKLFLKHTKPKKWYEVLKMSEMTAKIARSLHVNHVVDIGSGLGHLSRISGYGFGLNVLSIEGEEAFSEEAKKLDREFEIKACKLLSESEREFIERRRPTHIKKTVTCDLHLDDFLKLVTESLGNKDDKSLKFGIVGLHPCGDLALKLLTFFVNCREIKFINIVCCCYHKITISSNPSRCPDANSGLISSYCLRNNMSIGQEARALACHALEAYRERLQKDDFDHLKIHCYRATLEHIINKNWPHLRKSQLSNVKHGPKLSFRAYCEKALRKIPVSVPEEDFESETTLEHLSNWKNVVIYYSLRLLLAPLVETVILIDRMLLLLENGCECRLEPVFEPEKSPRNFVLVGKKRE